jgi:3-deoxy-manno-octulosonate cytidylyltransferase (CMP-KDO synthetase)
MRVIGVIPARFGSSRFPGKPLADILGKPMLWWVYQQALKAKKLNYICVATDDERIVNVCKKYSMNYLMTDSSHRTAANRIWELSNSIEGDLFVSINGDEPLIDPLNIDAVVIDNITLNEPAGTNIITPIHDPAELMDPSNIKVVFDVNMDALYLSRAAIPFPNNTLGFEYFKHVGIIGYNKKMLDFYNNNQPGTFELIEGIDTLRFIDYKKQLKFIVKDCGYSLSVDTPKDLEKVIVILKSRVNSEE